jgi:hypothetical protein
MKNLKTMAMLLVATTLSIAAFAQGPPPALAAPPSPSATPDAITRFWILDKDMVWNIGNTEDSITVPAGFVTDYASIPRFLWSLGLSPYERYSRAAIIHDYLYWTQVCTKAQSDRILLIAMKESAVERFDEVAVYNGVVLGGQSSWDENARQRRDGWPRIVPLAFRQLPPNGLWIEHRLKLHNLGVHDPAFAKSPSFCKYGDSTDVPNIEGSSESFYRSLNRQANISEIGRERLRTN